MKNLKSLAQANQERMAVYAEPQYPRPNGIACPQCGNEMGDSDNLLLMSNPPQQRIECLNKDCNFITYRVR